MGGSVFKRRLPRCTKPPHITPKHSTHSLSSLTNRGPHNHALYLVCRSEPKLLLPVASPGSPPVWHILQVLYAICLHALPQMCSHILGACSSLVDVGSVGAGLGTS